MFAFLRSSHSRHTRTNGKSLLAQHTRRLALECLEDRLTPAPLGFRWVGGVSTGWDDKQNWTYQTGTGQPTRFPGSGGESEDTVIFDNLAQGDCRLNIDVTIWKLETSAAPNAFAKVFTINTAKSLTIKDKTAANGIFTHQSGTINLENNASL